MTFDPQRGSALDQHLDDAVRRVDDHVADYVTPAFDAAVRPRRSGAAVATGVAAVLLLVVAVVAATGGDPADDEVAGDVEPTSEFDEVGQAVGGPRDGLDSLRLPIEVTPSEGLADGQVVTVTGSQFPPNTQLGVVMCAQFPDRAPAGAGNCQLSPYTSVTSDADGNFQAEHPVDRVFTTSSGEQVDCAVAAAPCLVAVGAISDYDQSGVAPVSFDAGIPALPDPYASVSPTGPYTDGQEVVITASNLPPGTEVFVDLCAQSPSSGGCGTAIGGPFGAVADVSGRVEIPITMQRKVDVGFGPVDCAASYASCSLTVWGTAVDRTWSFELRFVGGDPTTTATTVPSIDIERSTSKLPETTDTTALPSIPTTSVPTTATTAPATGASSGG